MKIQRSHKALPKRDENKPTGGQADAAELTADQLSSASGGRVELTPMEQFCGCISTHPLIDNIGPLLVFGATNGATAGTPK